MPLVHADGPEGLVVATPDAIDEIVRTSPADGAPADVAALLDLGEPAGGVGRPPARPAPRRHVPRRSPAPGCAARGTGVRAGHGTPGYRGVSGGARGS